MQEMPRGFRTGVFGRDLSRFVDPESPNNYDADRAGGRMKLENWITGNPAWVESRASLREAVTEMSTRKIGAILVVDGGALSGIFTERDLLNLFINGVDQALDGPVSAVMTRDPVCASADEDYNSVFMKMQTSNIRHIPVLDDGRPVGIVSIRDLTRFYQNKLESEFVDAKREIVKLKDLLGESNMDKIQSLLDEVERYRELSLTDELTGLYNKRYFMSRLREECARAKRYEEPLSLVFCDIDYFKRINDTYGHHVGDKILSQVGSLLAGEVDELTVLSRLRKSDIVARFGGEEFVVILPETDLEGGRRAAEKMRTAVETHEYALNGERVGLSMSFGVSEFDVDGSSMDLIKQADEAMYRAKRNGRNRVELYEKLAP